MRRLGFWDILLTLSILGIGVDAWFISTPPKAPLDTSAGLRQSIRAAESKTQAVEDRASASLSETKDRTWDLTAEVFGSTALEAITGLCDKNHLHLAGFRMGKAIPAASLKEAPFVVIVEGTFVDVMSMVDKVEQPDSKMALSQLNIASGSVSDRVTATLTLTGFLYREAK
jgi:hypothetical protein